MKENWWNFIQKCRIVLVPFQHQVEDLFTTVRTRKIAVELGFEKLFLKNEVLKCFFVSNPDSPYFQSETFNLILQFLQKATNKAKLKTGW